MKLITSTAMLFGFALTTGACSTSDTPADDDVVPGDPDAAPPDDPDAPPQAATGIPYGLWGPFDTTVETPPEGVAWTGASSSNSNPESMLENLAVARQRGIKVWARMTGGPAQYQDPVTLHFDLAKWKAKLAVHAPYYDQYLPYIEDGTLLGLKMLDDLNSNEVWGSSAGWPTWDEVDECARYSKSLMPALTTAVRGAATQIAMRGEPYLYLDTAWAQYSHRLGEVHEYIANNVAAAQASNVGLVVGLNVLNGGQAVPGCAAYGQPTRCSMTGAEIVAWAEVLLTEPRACGFFMWELDEAHYAAPGIREAMAQVAAIAAAHPAVSCRP